MSANMMALLMPSGWSDRFPRWARGLGSRGTVSTSLGVSSRMLLFLTPRQWPEAATLPWNQQKINPPPAARLAQGHTDCSKQTSSCWCYQAERETMLGAQGSSWIFSLQTHSLLCLEEDSKYMHRCCLLSQQTAGLSELRLFYLRWLPCRNGFSHIQV